ncbi:glycoside hydrolase family 16 protein [Sphingobacterium bovisgrunnientis]|uniref:glycoside hydrolase family 16 protein n=1 Tax=Sphingobacterium bovisgrunnientis TaxID=1874697 RepID=UPI001357D8BB|nr:glycoside hydrolase family 16 protein [Sphingobacterium bovisgrunnientis]
MNNIIRAFVKIFIAGLILSTFIQCAVRKININTPKERQINFSGHKWLVRNTGANIVGPGPNLFSNSEDNVWVDKTGKLHLRIINRKGLWYCSEVTLDEKVGHGKYIFYISSSLSSLDENAVAGLFTYLNDNQEIDIEFSKWSDVTNQNTQFVVQPHDNPENIFRFNIDDYPERTVHSFEWKEESISFESIRETHPQGQTIAKWTYKGKNIPKQSEERLKINLWLFQGKSPISNNINELIIDSVKYIPFNEISYR